MVKPTKNKKKVQKAIRVPRTLSSRLDAQGMAWARLLADPCAAPLAHPCYAGADGGVLARFENSIDVGTSATITNGAFFWTPGALGLNSTFPTCFASGQAISSGVAMTAVSSYAAGDQPGYTYLAAQASSFRCVAACMQITYLGTESARSGVINYGAANGTTFTQGDAVSAATLSNVLEKFTRTPVGTVDVKWRPSNFDQVFKDTTATPSATDLAKNSALGVVFSGLQATAGLRLRLVAVYEYQPANNTGMVNTASSRNTSNASLDHVINYLDAAGDWMYSAANSAGRVIRGAQAIAPYVQAVGYAGSRALAIMA